MAMTSQSDHCGHASNKYLERFLRTRSDGEGATATAASSDVKEVLHVRVTIVNEPRNTIDILHRAGRTGLAGQQGKVVILGKLKGRGSQRTKDTKKRIEALAV